MRITRLTIASVSHVLLAGSVLAIGCSRKAETHKAGAPSEKEPSLDEAKWIAEIQAIDLYTANAFHEALAELFENVGLTVRYLGPLTRGTARSGLKTHHIGLSGVWEISEPGGNIGEVVALLFVTPTREPETIASYTIHQRQLFANLEYLRGKKTSDDPIKDTADDPMPELSGASLRKFLEELSVPPVRDEAKSIADIQAIDLYTANAFHDSLYELFDQVGLAPKYLGPLGQERGEPGRETHHIALSRTWHIIDPDAETRQVVATLFVTSTSRPDTVASFMVHQWQTFVQVEHIRDKRTPDDSMPELKGLTLRKFLQKLGVAGEQVPSFR